MQQKFLKEFLFFIQDIAVCIRYHGLSFTRCHERDIRMQKVFVHPEFSPDVVALADYEGSTSGILEYATKSDAQEFIICTETGIFYNLQKANPDKKFYAVKKHQVCDDMKKITLEKVELALKQGIPMELDENLMKKAEGALKQMHQIAQ